MTLAIIAYLTLISDQTHYPLDFKSKLFTDTSLKFLSSDLNFDLWKLNFWPERKKLLRYFFQQSVYVLI